MPAIPLTAARVAGGAVSGLLLLAAFPPIEQRWIALVALVPLLLALREASWRQGLLAGLGFGWAFFGILLYWISTFGLVAWFALTTAMAAFAGLFGASAAVVARAGVIGRLAGVPLVWIAVEMLRGRVPFGGFTWGGLGYSQHDGGSMVSIARVGGVHLLGLAIVLANALLAELIVERRSRARAGLALAAVALVLAPALLPIGLAGPRTGFLDVAAVQGNVPRGSFTGIGRGGRLGPDDVTIVRNHLEVTARLEGTTPPDLVVWPENAFDRDPRAHPDLFEPVRDVARRLRTPFVVGAILDDGDRFLNSNLLVDPEGEIAARYDKVHLVPFGEYVPLAFARSLVPALDREIPVDGRAGRELVTFDLPAARVGSIICFESTFPELVRDSVRTGSQVILVTTNNASFGTSPAAAQHLAMSRLRAIEHGRPVVHAAISGISAIVMPDGEIIQRSRLFTQALLRAPVPLTEGTTPYTRYGAGIELAMGLGAAIAAGWALWLRRKRA